MPTQFIPRPSSTIYQQSRLLPSYLLSHYIQIISYQKMSGEQMDEILLPNDELEKIMQETIEAELASKVYEQKEVPCWINRINELLIEKLVQQQKPYKYLVNTMIMQRKGTNMVISQSNIWDTGLDSHFTLAWPKETANKAEKSKNTIQCMVSVYAMSTLNSNSLINSEL